MPVHTFHIPVMGTGFTIDTPLKVARYGIASVVSLVDDVLIEQMRRSLSAEHGEACEPIEDQADDARARRITAYLDLLDTVVGRQIARLREAAFEAGSEIVRYFEMLPPSPLRSLYERMSRPPASSATSCRSSCARRVVPGAIDVNIMTKLDRDHDRGGRLLPERGSDALSALRGFMNSRLRSSVVLSAGMNRRLFSYMAEFADMFPDENGELRKRIILKVSDFRSALVQGKLLAKLGLHVSEFRVESGLNCGGHAFGGKGQLLGPILAEFKRERERLARPAVPAPAGPDRAGPRRCARAAAPRITVQGGIGTAEEDLLLRQHYGSTARAGPALPAGARGGQHRSGEPGPARGGHREGHRAQRRLAAGRAVLVAADVVQRGGPSAPHRPGPPGSRCPKGYLVSNTEFTATPICTASRAYQRRKLEQIAGSEPSARQRSARPRPSSPRRASATTWPAAPPARAGSIRRLAPRSAAVRTWPTSSVGPACARWSTTSTDEPCRWRITARTCSSRNCPLHVARLREDVRRLASDPGENLARSITECSEQPAVRGAALSGPCGVAHVNLVAGAAGGVPGRPGGPSAGDQRGPPGIARAGSAAAHPSGLPIERSGGRPTLRGDPEVPRSLAPVGRRHRSPGDPPDEPGRRSAGRHGRRAHARRPRGLRPAHRRGPGRRGSGDPVRRRGGHRLPHAPERPGLAAGDLRHCAAASLREAQGRPASEAERPSRPASGATTACWRRTGTVSPVTRRNAATWPGPSSAPAAAAITSSSSAA
jgi:hypothetical protein